MIILWNRGVATPVSGVVQRRRYAFVRIFEIPVGGGSSIAPIVMYYRENGII